ncbi:MAG: hypothetical protein QM831_39540 [Kofleriaceae bacterium]
MTSLSELKAIHTQRIADERTQFEQARARDLAAKHAAEQAIRNAEQERVQAERDAQLRVEETRLAVEREARLKIEAIEAAERARHDAELSARRQEQEMELRREEVRKKRPRWMLAVTVLAIAGGVAFGAVAIKAMHESDVSAAATAAANAQKEQARAEAKEAAERVAAIEKDATAVHDRLVAAEDALAKADTDAARDKARKAIEQAKRDEAEHNRKLREWKDKQDAIIRGQGLHNNGCTDTALGCMK